MEMTTTKRQTMKPSQVMISKGQIVRLYAINTKAIKKAMKNYMIQVVSCTQVSSGSSKGSSTIIVKTKDAEKAVYFFREMGIVNCLGSEIKLRKCGNEEYSFSAVYLSEEMFKEINS